MAVLQFASLELEIWAFIYGVIHHALKVFSSLEHVVKEYAQVMSELEKLKRGAGGGGAYEYEKSKLFIDQSIHRNSEIKSKVVFSDTIG